MMKSVAVLAIAGSAAAFAPSNQARMSTGLSATEAQMDFFGIQPNTDFSKEVGVLPPVSSMIYVSLCDSVYRAILPIYYLSIFH